MAGPGKTTAFMAGVGFVMTTLLAAGTAPTPVAAQSGWWPWASETNPGPRPPPVRRDTPLPPPVPPAGMRSPGQAPGGFSGSPARSAVCLQLEQRLVDDQQRGTQTRDALPRIEGEMRQVERTLRQGEAHLERSDCYDYFLFSKTLRRTRQCVDAANQVDVSRRRLAELDAQRRQLLGGGGGGTLQDDLIRELARNNCGPQYQKEAQRRGPGGPFSSLWQDEDTAPAGRGNDFGNLPFATYRTVCVRLCDGYFFPISFSTLENHFGRDAEACQSKCAAPVELYFHQNPGGSMEQAMSVSDRRPYSGLKTAFRYRKEFVQGCSCKQTEYTPSPTDQGGRRTDMPATMPPTKQAQRP